MDRGPLSGCFIYVLANGWPKQDVLDVLGFIRRNGGITLSDPLVGSVTHIVVRPPPCTARDEDDHPVYPVGELQIPASIRGWDFDHIVSAFTLPENRARLMPEKGSAVVSVVHENWLQASVKEGRPLGVSENYGGWLVVGKLERDPRKRRLSRPDISPGREPPAESVWQRDGPRRGPPPPPFDRRDSRGVDARDDRRVGDASADPRGWDDYFRDGRGSDASAESRKWDDYFRDGRDRGRGREPPPVRRLNSGPRPRSSDGGGSSRPQSPGDHWRPTGPPSPTLSGTKRPRSPDALRPPQTQAQAHTQANGNGEGKIMTLRQRLNYQMTHQATAQDAVAAPEPQQAALPAAARLKDRISRAQELAEAHARSALADSHNLASRLGQRVPSSVSTSPLTSAAVSPSPASKRGSPPAPPASAPLPAQSAPSAPSSMPTSAPPPSTPNRQALPSAPTPASTSSAPESDRPRKRAALEIKTEPMEVDELDELLGGNRERVQAEPEPPRKERARTPPASAPLPRRRLSPPIKQSPTLTRAAELPAHGARAGTPLFSRGPSERPRPLASPPQSPIPLTFPSAAGALTSGNGRSNAPACPSRSVEVPLSISEADDVQELVNHLGGGGVVPADVRQPTQRATWTPSDSSSDRRPTASARPSPSTTTSNSANTRQSGSATTSTRNAAPSDTARADHGLGGRVDAEAARPRRRSVSAHPPSVPERPRGVFFWPGKPRLTFYVEGTTYKQGIEEAITASLKQGGGDITSITTADFIVLPLNKGEVPTDPRHRELAAKVGINPCARVVSREWIIDSVIIQGRLLDPDNYIVPRPRAMQADGSVGASLSSGAATGAAPSAPSSTVSSNVAGKRKSRPLTGPGPGASHAGPSRQPPTTHPFGHSNSRTKSPDDITPLESEDEDFEYFDDGSNSESRVMSWDEDNVHRLITELRQWDEIGGKTNFLKKLAADGTVPGATGIYHRYRPYINEQVPALLRHSRIRKTK